MPVDHGAASADVNFTPYRAVPAEKATESAVRFYDGDKRSLSKAGAEYVGELEVHVLSSRAAAEAAKLGATHFLLVEGADAARARFALFRIDPNRWSELPVELRPATMAGEPTSTTVVTSAPLR